MGEVFNGHKLGTCDHLMYITREELLQFAPEKRNESGGNLPYIKDYLDVSKRWLYRFPREYDQAKRLEDIDGRKPDDYLKLYVPGKLELPHKQSSQYLFINRSTGFEETFNLDFCPMDAKHWGKGIRPTACVGWNKDAEEVPHTPIYVIGNQYTEEYPDGYTVFATVCCDMWFSLNTQEIEKYIYPDMLGRGLDWEAQFIKARG